MLGSDRWVAGEDCSDWPALSPGSCIVILHHGPESAPPPWCPPLHLSCASTSSGRTGDSAQVIPLHLDIKIMAQTTSACIHVPVSQ